MAKLYLKQALVGTRLAPVLERIRWIRWAPYRVRHPELWDLHLESKRIGIALETLIEPDHNCVDIGAHLGSVLAEMTRLAPHGSHIAFEPVPEKAQGLRKKFPHAEIIEAATSDEAGTAPFFEDLTRSGYSGLRQPAEDSNLGRYEVEVVRLDDRLSSADKIDFIKIDVEGAELSTLLGAKTVLARHQPAILFECSSDDEIERFGHSRAGLFAYFGDHDYNVYSVVDFVYGRDPMTPESFQKAGTYPYRGFNYIALPESVAVTRLL